MPVPSGIPGRNVRGWTALLVTAMRSPWYSARLVALWAANSFNAAILDEVAPPRGNAEARLLALLRLREPRRRRAPQPAGDWTQLRDQTLRNMKAARSYCSRFDLRETSRCFFFGRMLAEIRWRVDHVAPGRWHVSQMMAGRGASPAYDEWISIDGKCYQHAGLWLLMHSDVQRELNERLSCRPALSVLAEAEPDIVEVCECGDNRLMVAQYRWSGVEDIIRQHWLAEGKDFAGMDPSPLVLWIDMDAHELVRADVSFRAGRRRCLAFKQVFACINETIVIEPPQWINGVAGEDNKFVCLDDRVASVPHHQ